MNGPGLYFLLLILGGLGRLGPLLVQGKSVNTIFTYVSVKSKLQHPPPPPPQGIPQAFDTFGVPGRREFDHQSLPGGQGVGNLIPMR